MWLLDTKDNNTPRLKSVRESDLEPDPNTGSARVQYAIFSHTWAANEDEEVGFDTLTSGNFSRTLSGWRKIQHCRQQAAHDGFDYVWIDTCCIDKRSSAELQEAINSMFHWYARSSICYVFLTDVSIDDLDHVELATHANCRHLKTRDPGVMRIDNAFSKSHWFKRGWTLQELLAPRCVHFYDKSWRFIGDKTSLQCWISRASGIDGDIIRGDYTLQQCSIAMRMSWAAKRRTTRVEDRAYSLLGLFDVAMPMLYGEGKKAFMRLQEEIIKTSDDQSIFVWESEQTNHIGMLAPDLDTFEGKGTSHFHDFFPPRGFSLSNRGLLIKMPLIQWSLDTCIAVLNCGTITGGKGQPQGIYLRRLGNGNQYGRVHYKDRHTLRVDGHMPESRSVYVRQRPLNKAEMYYLDERAYEFEIDEALLVRSDPGAPPSNIAFGEWQNENITQPPGARPFPVAVIDISHAGLKAKWLSLGFNQEFQPAIVFADTFTGALGNDHTADSDLKDLQEHFSNVDLVDDLLLGKPVIRSQSHQGLLKTLEFPECLRSGYNSEWGMVRPSKSVHGTLWACKAHLDTNLLQFVLMDAKMEGQRSPLVTLKPWSATANRALWNISIAEPAAEDRWPVSTNEGDR